MVDSSESNSRFLILEDLGKQERADAHCTNGLFLFMELFQDTGDLLMDVERTSVDCVVGEILSNTKSTWKNNGLIVFSFKFSNVLNFTSCNSGRFNQDISSLSRSLSCQVIDNLSLVFIGGKALEINVHSVEMDHQRDNFCHLRTIVDTTSGKD